MATLQTQPPLPLRGCVAQTSTFEKRVPHLLGLVLCDKDTTQSAETKNERRRESTSSGRLSNGYIPGPIKWMFDLNIHSTSQSRMEAYLFGVLDGEYCAWM